MNEMMWNKFQVYPNDDNLIRISRPKICSIDAVANTELNIYSTSGSTAIDKNLAENSAAAVKATTSEYTR